MARPLLRNLVTVGFLAWSAAAATAADVKGRVVMPDSCSPLVSPAVVTLEPVAPLARVGAAADAPVVALVKQQGLQFEPRVQLGRVGQPIRFTNGDNEPHNVHSATPGVVFSWSMAPNSTQEYTPVRPGLIRLVCDVHAHMRGYVVVTDSPWARVVGASGAFSFRDVPAGRYTLNAWHEMGQPYRSEVVVGADAVTLDAITLQGSPVAATTGPAAPIRDWPEVIDRIVVLLGEARELVKKPDGYDRARKLAEDAYFGEFELSDMETAVKRHLGLDRGGVIESHFRACMAAVREIKDGKLQPSQFRTRVGKLLVELSRASEDLKQLQVFDRRDVAKVVRVVHAAADPAPMLGADAQSRQLAALAASFAQVERLAAAGQRADAASALGDAYFGDFEPLERLLNIRSPQAVAPLEARFVAVRGLIQGGGAGAELAAQLAGLRGETAAALDRANRALAGSFPVAFAWSLTTILREGVEVILLLTMLLALAAKAGQAKAVGAIRWGVAAAVVASLGTAVALGMLVASTQGRTQEFLEGAVMMVAAAILFYVSYWLISQTQAKRWADFLKQQATHGAQAGGLWTLAATSFLAVYREGAETALLYQAQISGQGGSRDGLMGVAAGLALGLVLLGGIAYVFRATSVRLPMRPFFKFTGFALFAMAVVFAGNGVYALQAAGYIKVTPVAWVGLGVPALGLHPNVQTLVIQGFLIFGALMTLVLPIFERAKPVAAPVKAVPARVGVGLGV